MIKGSFVRLLKRDEGAASRIYENVVRFFVYAEKKSGKLKLKNIKFVDFDKIEIGRDDTSESYTLGR